MFLLLDKDPSPGPKGKIKVFAKEGTALSRQFSPLQAQWLLDYVTGKWTDLHSSLLNWRNKLDHYEKMADDDYSDRKTEVDYDRTDAARPIYERENNNLGVVSSACDSVYAKAKDDIFGTRPWLAATPQGVEDKELAENITRHSQWKFDQSNLEEALVDAIKLAIDLGTAFVKLRWLKEPETYIDSQTVAWSRSKKAAVMTEAGEYITDENDIPADYPNAGNDIEWKEIEVEQTRIVYNNIDACCVDYKDIAFDPAAPSLDLRHTPVFCKFKMGLHDIVATYKLTDDQRDELMNAASILGTDENARAHRAEESTTSSMDLDTEANPEINLVEGFIRCNPLGTGNPIRIRVVFSPDLNAIFHVDYLAKLTPDGMTPIFPVRCFKVARRVIGKGYRERFEKDEDFVDTVFNSIIVRQREAADVYVGFKKEAFADELEGKDVINFPGKMFELSTDAKSIEDGISFVTKPDNNGRSDSLMQLMLQMIQLRTGNVSASQNQLTGIPSNDTATGSKLIAGKADTLTTCQIDQMMGDLEKPVEFCVHLNYANLDRKEAFTWGEGKDVKLLFIEPNDVQGLRCNVSLALNQSQNLQKLEAAKAAIGIYMQYPAIPETDKAGARALFIQALRSLGFHEAEDVIREPVMDAAGIDALLPPDLKPVFQAFLQQIGMVPPAEGMPGEAPANTPPPIA